MESSEVWKIRCDNAYKAGAQSKQAEIDLLEKELIETQGFLNRQNHIKQAEIDELRKRIDESLLIVERMAKATNSTAMWAFDLDKALKGTTNEQ